MTKTPQSSRPADEEEGGAAPTAVERVPPEAEDFAHTLRRLAARRAAERAAKPGLYR